MFPSVGRQRYNIIQFSGLYRRGRKKNEPTVIGYSEAVPGFNINIQVKAQLWQLCVNTPDGSTSFHTMNRLLILFFVKKFIIGGTARAP